jgi:hypothetical protein
MYPFVDFFIPIFSISTVVSTQNNEIDSSIHNSNSTIPALIPQFNSKSKYESNSPIQ